MTLALYPERRPYSSLPNNLREGFSMRATLVLLSMLIASPAFAFNDAVVNLVCWDAKSKTGSAPVMKVKAHYDSKNPADGATVTDVRFPNNTDEYEYLPRVVRGIFQPKDISDARSPYKGNYDYELMDTLRLVLTKDVSPEGLKTADVDGRGKGHVGVLDIDQDLHRKWSGGNFYIRMRCKAE